MENEEFMVFSGRKHRDYGEDKIKHGSIFLSTKNNGDDFSSFMTFILFSDFVYLVGCFNCPLRLCILDSLDSWHQTADH